MPPRPHCSNGFKSHHDRVFGMVPTRAAFYVLAQIYERRGDAARRAKQYLRFLDLWRDGDMERGWVADAQKKL